MQIISIHLRNQLEFGCLEDKITSDNSVRFIDAFVEHIDLEQLGFQPRAIKQENITTIVAVPELVNSNEYGTTAAYMAPNLHTINQQIRTLVRKAKHYIPQARGTKKREKEIAISLKNIEHQNAKNALFDIFVPDAKKVAEK